MRSLESQHRVIVVDLGFGDAGKGTVTDWLVRNLRASAVVRFNGGAQAGHNVVTPDGRHHTFAQFGAGSFVPGVRTFLSKHVLFHPTALLVEADHLRAVGVSDALCRIVVSEECLVTTPLHQAATCLRELARGAARHGSCGVGIGETMRDALASPDDAIRAGDLRDGARLRRSLARLQSRKRDELAGELRALPRGELGGQPRAALEDPAVLDAWAAATREVVDLGVVQDDHALSEVLRGPSAVVFEGAQGVLLDEWVGFHPFTTWSTCTFDNAEALLEEHRSPGRPFRLGVVRTFATRHGAGPFPTEAYDAPRSRTREHNDDGPWQGRFRTGAFDAVLTRYAIAASGGIDGLALTHLDRFEHGEAWSAATAHDLPAGRVEDLKVGPRQDLMHVEAMGNALMASRPVIETITRDADGVVRRVEQLVGAPVVLTSRGPTALGKEVRVGELSMKSNKFAPGCTPSVP